MTELVGYLSQHEVLRNVLASAAVTLLLLLVRSVTFRLLKSSSWPEEVRIRARVQLRGVLLMAWAGGLALIWAAELRSAAISAVAVAAALVLATKELLLCLLGSVVRATSGAFSTGDRVEIGSFRGDVIDLQPLTTTIMEVGPGHRRTGRVVVLPNSLLLSTPVRHESFTEDFVLHTIVFPVAADADWRGVERRMLSTAREVSAGYSERARASLARSAIRQGLPELSTEPRVYLHVPDPGCIHLMLRMPCPAKERGSIEQAVLRAACEKSPEVTSSSSD